MVKFKKGDRIVCIDSHQGSQALTNGEVYTVECVYNNSVILYGRYRRFMFRSDRFIPLKEYRRLKIQSLYDEI